MSPSTPPPATLPDAIRVLSEIARALESADEACGRVERALELLRQLLACDRCALLVDAPTHLETELCVVPGATGAEREVLAQRLSVLRRRLTADDVEDEEEEDDDDDEGEHGERSGLVLPHLAMPIVGLDETIGILLVERAADDYREEDLRLLAVVATLLGTYLTMLRLRNEEAARSQALAAANEFYGLLMAVVSHDLRNPITAILLRATALQRSGQAAELTGALERITASARHANRIISDLLDLTLVRVRGVLPTTPRPTDLAQLARQVVEEQRMANPGRIIELTASPTVPGEWDPDRLEQLLGNLVSNALRYSPPGTPVRVGLDVVYGHAVLTVHNDGGPIPEELRSVLFDPYRRGADWEKESGPGLGLGLYIVAQIVRAHQGTVSFESSRTEGTTFTITLPPRVGARVEEHAETP